MKKVLLIFGILILVFAAYFVKSGIDFYWGIYKKSPSGNGSILPVKKDQFNILMLGYGGPGHDGPYLTDSIMVVHVDTTKNKVALISLPRDLWVKLPTKSGQDFHSKINSIFQMTPSEYPDVSGIKLVKDDKYHSYEMPGGIDLLKKSVGAMTGLTIDNYLTIDFSGFEKAIDVLGGVDVKVLKTFDDYGYPVEGKEADPCGHEKELAQIDEYNKLPDDNAKAQYFKDHPDAEKFYQLMQIDPPTEAFPCRFEHLHFDAGVVHMDGKTALKYVRSRHSLQDGTDFGRAARQQLFVQSVKEKVISLGMITKVVPLLDELKSHIQTDISVEDMQKFMGEAKDAASYRILNIRMSDSDYLKSSFSDYGGYILIPRIGEDKWSEIHQVVQNGINEITPTPSPRPTLKVSPTTKAVKK